MNKVIKQECVADLFGLKGRAHNVVMDDETKIIRNQKISLSRLIEYDHDADKGIVIYIRELL